LDRREVRWVEVKDVWAARKDQNLLDGTVPPERLPKVIRLALGEYPGKCKTVYATMHQAPPVPPSASMGAEGVGSGSGALEVVVKGETKKSIGVDVYVVCGLRC
jgi:hypothetical protein